MTNTAITRRELLRRSGDVGGALALPMLLRAGPSTEGNASATASPTGLRPGPDVYESIGVRPLINARGTYTIISGSVMLPEVRAAMAAAAQRYVHLDELTDAIGARLATLTGAEWGVVTSGCAAALTHATAACVAGGNPDLHVRIPDLRGFPRDEAIIPKHSRNVYDAAVRAVGLRVLEVETMADFEAALGPRTALVYLFAGPAADASPLSLQPSPRWRRREACPSSSMPPPRSSRAERASAARRHAGRLQRGQVPARPPDGGPAAREQAARDARHGCTARRTTGSHAA